MLILSRKVGDSIVIDGEIKVTVLRVGTTRVRFGIEAPAHVSVVRGELIQSPILPLGHSRSGETESQPT